MDTLRIELRSSDCEPNVLSVELSALKLMDWTGFEPAAPRLITARIITILCNLYSAYWVTNPWNWWLREDSNLHGIAPNSPSSCRVLPVSPRSQTKIGGRERIRTSTEVPLKHLALPVGLHVLLVANRKWWTSRESNPGLLRNDIPESILTTIFSSLNSDIQALQWQVRITYTTNLEPSLSFILLRWYRNSEGSSDS